MFSKRAARSVGRLAIAASWTVFLPGCGEDGSSMPSQIKDSDTDAAATTAPALGSSVSDAGVDIPTPDADLPAFDPEVPPTDVNQVAAWLDQGFYNDWACESAATAKTGGAAAIHVHGASSRVCSNVLMAAMPAPGNRGGQFRSGAAAVKEVYDDSDVLLGRFVELKVEEESAAGAGWFWYKDAGGELGGLGLTGCTGCHGAAASDADHPGAGDYVYWQVTDQRELPPVGDVQALSTWLESGAYQDWDCEPEPTQKSAGAAAIHAHGALSRICSNHRLASATAGDPVNWKAGSASVKELFAADGGAAGYAVSLKVNTDSAIGEGWYWFDSSGTAGFGVSACAGCHSAAGSDDDHPGAGDYAYFRVER